MDTRKLIKTLSDAPGPSGFEDEVLEKARKYLKDDFKISEDRVRNLYVRDRSADDKLPCVMLDAHADEVGFMIQSINASGTMKFQPLGGWNAQTASAHAVRVKNTKGRWIKGVIATKPIHFMEPDEIKKPVSLSSMVIDVGAVSNEEIQDRFHIRIGAPVVPDTACYFDKKNGLIVGKAFDDRLGCAALLEVMKQHISEISGLNIVGVLSSQEEVGLRGVNVAARQVNPDAAIVLEGTPADDTFNSSDFIQAGLKRGPQIRHMDRSVLSNPRFVRFAVDIAQKHKIPFQEAVRSGGGNNASVITLHDRGIPAITLGVPVRYIHAHHCIAAIEDYQNMVRWCAKILEALTPDIIEGF